MNYELVKQLEDAGFPDCFTIVSEDMYSEPSLLELIEACGDEIKGLIKKNTLWWAIEEFELSDYYGDEEDYYGYDIGKGDTPEEAVANLWLRLKK